MKKGTVKKVYQIWGVNYYTGEELRCRAYNSKSSAYRVRKAMGEDDPYWYYYTVIAVTPEEHERQLREEVPIEKARQKLKMDCHQFIEENGNIMCTRFAELLADPEFEKQAMTTINNGHHEYTCEIVSCPEDSAYISSVLTFVSKSLEPGTYDFGVTLKLKKHELANDAGECFYVFSCDETFKGMREHLSSVMNPALVVRHLKELLTRKIFRNLDSRH